MGETVSHCVTQLATDRESVAVSKRLVVDDLAVVLRVITEKARRWRTYNVTLIAEEGKYITVMVTRGSCCDFILEAIRIYNEGPSEALN